MSQNSTIPGSSLIAAGKSILESAQTAGIHEISVFGEDIDSVARGIPASAPATDLEEAKDGKL